MNILNKLCFSIIPLFLFAVQPALSYVEQDIAVVRIMDKVAGKTQSVSIKVGSKVKVDSLNIKVQNCKKSDPFDAENFFVFLEIYTKSDERIFSGWMNRNEPGQNPLQNDTYDVWLEKCE